MDEYTVDEILHQTNRLSEDFIVLTKQLVPQWTQQRLPARPKRILVVGSGDSLLAGRAAAMSLADAGIEVTADSATAALARGTERMLRGIDLAIVTSASGTNSECVRVADAYRRTGVPVVALTGAQQSPVVDVGTDAVVWTLDGLRPSPGIRTYQASLLGLMSLGWAGMGSIPELGHLSSELAEAPSAFRGLIADLVEQVTAGMRLEDHAPVVLASADHVASAGYVAAKLTESAGVLARHYELEEWWHVSRFAESPRTPLILLDPPPALRAWSSQILGRARARGHTVLTTASALDRRLPESAWPLWHCRLGAAAGHALAVALGRRPFEGSTARATTGDGEAGGQVR